MTIAEKLTTIAENEPKVYEAGQKAMLDLFWESIQQSGKRTGYNRAFLTWSNFDEIFYPKYDIVSTADSGDASQMFRGVACNNPFDLAERLEECGVKLDTSAAKSLVFLFSYAQQITRVPEIDLSALTDGYYTHGIFLGCIKLETIDGIVPASVAYRESIFQNCTALKNISFTDDITTSGLNFQYSPLLTKESIQGTIGRLSADVSDQSITFSLSAVNKAFETSEGAADGSTSEEWLSLSTTKENWTIALV